MFFNHFLYHLIFYNIIQLNYAYDSRLSNINNNTVNIVGIYNKSFKNITSYNDNNFLQSNGVIIENSTPDIDLTIYDYIQLNRRVEIAQHLKKFNVYKKKRDWAKYYELVRNKKKIIASLFLRH